MDANSDREAWLLAAQLLEAFGDAVDDCILQQIKACIEAGDEIGSNVWRDVGEKAALLQPDDDDLIN